MQKSDVPSCVPNWFIRNNILHFSTPFILQVKSHIFCGYYLNSFLALINSRIWHSISKIVLLWKSIYLPIHKPPGAKEVLNFRFSDFLFKQRFAKQSKLSFIWRHVFFVFRIVDILWFFAWQKNHFRINPFVPLALG